MLFRRIISLATFVSLLGSIGLCASGCAKKEKESPLENYSFSDSTDVYKVPAGDAAAPDPATVIAVVGDKEITQAEINQEIQNALSRAPQPVPPERMGQLRAQITPQIVDSLVMKELLSKAVEENEVELTEAEYEEGIGKLKASLPPDVPLEDHLQRLGMTEDEFKEALSLDLKINKMIKEEVADIGEPTDEEIMAFYEENKQRFAQPERVKASHILLAVEPTDDEAAKAEKKAKAEEILKQINEGADFAALASQESDCPSKENGGDLGFFTRDRMVKPFADAAFEMDVDTVSDIVETRFGYHIIKVTEHEEAAEVPLEEVKERINEGLLAQKRQQAIQTYLDNLQEAANVEYPNGKPERPAPPQGAMRGMPQQGQPRPQPAQ